MEMSVKVSNCRVSPQKARLVADVIRGKKVVDAYQISKTITNKSAVFFYKLLHSAIANVENNFNGDIGEFYIKEVFVDRGKILSRVMPRAKGRADRISKPYSHINIKLSTIGSKF